MRTMRLLPKLLFCLGLSAAAAFAADDAAKSYEQLKKQMEDLSKSVGKYNIQLNKTLKSLNSMAKADAKNVQKASKAFGKDVESLKKELKSTTDKVKDLQARRTAYFAAWEKSAASITDPALKKAADERRQKVMDAHTKATEDANQLRERIDKFMVKLGDLVNFLGSDPTGDAIATAKSSIDGVQTDGQAVSADVQKVIQRLNAFAQGQTGTTGSGN